MLGGGGGTKHDWWFNAQKVVGCIDTDCFCER